jgi:hypothetical protein
VKKSKWFLVLGALAVLAVFSASLSAQVSGRLSGSVVDQSGAAVPDATVGVYIAGGQEPVLSGKTNADGLFSFIAVRPDTYDVAIEATGFAKTVLRDVRVSPAQENSLQPVKLQLKSATYVVEVAADAPAVQLSNTELASTITASQVQNLPVLGRQVTNLFQTQPGVVSGSDVTSVNGLKSTFSTVTLDGINIQDNFIRTNGLDYAPMRTTIDQVSEVTVSIANSGTAAGGGTSQMVMSTKSGSNDFHGSAYWYNRNYKLAANDWFNNKSGVERPALNLNQFGGSLGGRIVRDKLFFFVNPEWYRDKEEESKLNTTLTNNARNGIFTYYNSSGVLREVPLNTLRSYTASTAIRSMIDQLPAGNSEDTGDGLNTTGYLFNARSNEFRDQLVVKLDFYATPKHSISGTYNYINNPTDRPDLGSFFTKVPPVSNTLKNHMMSLAWRWNPTPSLTNEARFGFVRASGTFDDSNAYASYNVAGLLFTNPLNTYMEQGRKTNTYHIQDNANWVKGKHDIQFGFQSTLLRIQPFNDAGIVPTYTLGISTANTSGLTSTDLPGIDSYDLATANSLYTNLAGIITSAAQTFNVTSTTSGFVSGATNIRNLTLDNYAGYIQDKWKVRPGLTLNLGLRYEYWEPLDEKDSLFLAPVITNNDVKATLLDSSTTLDFIGKSVGRQFYKADKNNIAPNIGIAWDPFGKGKTSIRAGYRIAFVNDNTVTTARNSVSTNSGLQSAVNSTNLVAYLSSPPAVATPTYKVPRTLADNYALSRTSAIGIPDPDLVTPYVHEWTLGVEHDFKGTIVALRYIGNHGSKLLRAIDYNQILYDASGFLADFKRAQSNAALAQAAGLGYTGTYNASIPGSQVLTVFPLLSSGGLLTNSTIRSYLQTNAVGTLADTYMTNGLNGSVNFYTNKYVQGANIVTNGGASNYNAIQLDVTKRIRGGLQAQFNYTFGKSLSNTSGDGQTNFEPLLDNANPDLEWARTPYDITHIFKANFYYELPYGQGKHWSGNALSNRILGGWAISGIWSYMSGPPFSVLSTYGTLNRAGRSAATNTVSVNGTTLSDLKKISGDVFMTGNGPYFVSPSVIASSGRGASSPTSATFDGQIFFNPAPGTVGNLQRRMLSGPWQWALDFSVIKSVKLYERHSLDLHVDFFNITNHPTFYVYPSTAGDYGYTGYVNANSSSFGKLYDMNYAPRRIQAGLYYRF